MQFQHNISLLFGRMVIVDMWSPIPAIASYTWASSTPAMANWVGRCEMCMGGLRQGYRELHTGELHT
jgi:hypothetical protein